MQPLTSDRQAGHEAVQPTAAAAAAAVAELEVRVATGWFACSSGVAGHASTV